MNRDSIIDGLRMTMDLCVFDPSTGEEIEPHLLNDISRATYDNNTRTSPYRRGFEDGYRKAMKDYKQKGEA